MNKLREFLILFFYISKKRSTGNLSIFISTIFIVGALSAILCQFVMADDGKNISGSPEGSYDLSEMESINLFNGSLSFQVPVVRLRGRGTVGYSVVVATQNLISTIPQPYTVCDIENPENCETYTNSVINNNGISNGTSYEPLKINPRLSNEFYQVSVNEWHVKTLFSLQITFPDGTSHTLYDTATDGRPYSGIFLAPFPAASAGFDRGTTFRSLDGSDITFIGDNSFRDSVPPFSVINSLNQGKGLLLLRDGTKYQIDNFKVSTITDRNGNVTTFQHETPVNGISRVTQVTDSIGRNIVFNYGTGQNYDPNPPDQYVDTITYSGLNGSPLSVKLHYGKMHNALRPAMNGYPAASIQTVYQLYGQTPCCAGIPGDYLVDGIVDPYVTTQIEYVDGRSMYLKYNSYSELALVKLSTGGMISYEYDGGFAAGSGSGIGANGLYYIDGQYQVNRRIKERRLQDTDGAVTFLSKYDVDTNSPTSTNPRFSYKGYTSEENYLPDADGEFTRISKIKHFYYGNPIREYLDDYMYWRFERSTYNSWNEGKEYRTEVYGSNGTSLLRATDITWQQKSNTSVGWWTSNSGYPQPANNPRITSIKTSVTEGTKTLSSAKVFGYDESNRFNNQTDVWAYDFGTGNSIGRLLKHTQTGYLKVNPVNNIDYTTDTYHMHSIPIWSKTFDVKPDNSEVLISQTESKYDEPTFPVLTYGGTQTGWVDVQSVRGNPTTAGTWFSEENRWLESHIRYDQFGNVRKTWDHSGDSDKYIETEYSADYKYAFPTKITTPAPDPTGSHGTEQTSAVVTTFDFYTGLPLTVTDEFGQTTGTEYNDAMMRPKRTYAVNFVAPEIRYDYGDAIGNLYVKTTKQIDPTNWDEATNYMDGFGRTIKSKTKDSQGDVFVDTHYDGMGRVDRITNPYRAGDKVYWSKTRFDNLGRAVESYAPAELSDIDSENLTSLGNTSFDISNTGDVGTIELATDASGRQSRSITNVLGQIIRVDEPIPVNSTDRIGQLGTVDSPNQPTYYKYSPYGKLVQVTQGSQIRYLKYDTLGRLIRVNQPEQDINAALDLEDSNNTLGHWTAGFTYDILGNVETATDARGVTITNTYDRANRIKTRSYMGETAQQTTPDVNYYYDGKGLTAQQTPNYAKGKLTKVDNGISATEYVLYDNLGRLSRTRQITDGVIYGDDSHPMTFQYNFAGDIVQETYPSGRTVKNEFEGHGDLTKVSSIKRGTSINVPYVSNIGYSASGSVSKLMLGNGLWETSKVNQRLQLYELGLGTSAIDTSIWKVHLDYGELDINGNLDSSKNAGNIAQQILTIPGAAFVQSYSYDPLYRLSQAKEVSGASQNWIQNWTYDRYGNRLTFTQNIGGNTNASNPAVDQNKNRFSDTNTFNYDKNGNVTKDKDEVKNQIRTFVYDGDSKQKEIKDASNNTIGKYYYDGEGHRIKKINGTTGEITIFVYSAGKLVAEYSTAGLPVNPAINFTTTDHLGSPRVITDQLGQVKSRRDFLPFGEELPTSVGNRSTYGDGDTVRQKFTGYQEDIESSLDFAEARMYENRYGRFTSVDPLLASGDSTNPQTFNRYVYVGNSPVGNTDPTGLDWYRRKSKDAGREFDYQWFDKNPGGDWESVNFGVGNNYYPVNDAYKGSSLLGTIYLDIYGDHYYTQAEFSAMMQRNSIFQPGGGCFANPQCAGVRDSVNDTQNVAAGYGFAAGIPKGIENKAKSYFDVPNWNLAPPPLNYLITDSAATRGLLNPWFNYKVPEGAYQQAGARTGGAALDLAVFLVSKRIYEFFPVRVKDKLDFTFGKATGKEHNLKRSSDMQTQLSRIGIYDNAEGRSIVSNAFKRNFYSTAGEMQSNGRTVRTGMLYGPRGILQFQTIWEKNKLITMKLFGKGQ